MTAPAALLPEENEQIHTLVHTITEALDDVKGKDIVVIDTSGKTPLFLRMILATGESNRQVRALARNVEEELKAKGFEVIGSEGLESGEWALVDAGDVIVHVMLPPVRDFYNIEELWGGQKPTKLP